jgi:3-phenylpropionate/trans-cinnamate dioxygenase ferredoxin reductase subunit
MSREYDVLIVGAGHGGAQASAALRQRGFQGSIALVDTQLYLPYQRPPLSKDYLSGQRGIERLLIRDESYWGQQRIDLLLGQRVVAIDAQAHQARTESDAVLHYKQLVWAAGGHARRLRCPGCDLDGVHSVRTRTDVDRIRSEISGAKTIAIVGGGYIGLEVAAVLTSLGKSALVLEMEDRVLSRVAGTMLSRFYEAEHRARGVTMWLGATVVGLEGRCGRVVGIELGDGRRVATDMVIVGIGIAPAVEPLLAAGAAGRNGIDVDEYCRTSLPDVYAIGDCAVHSSRRSGESPIRLESIQNANDMAITAAKTIMGNATPHGGIPWFWSDQYDLKLQTVGLSQNHDQEVLRGCPARRSFSIVYLREGRVIALDCVNAVGDYAQGRALVALNARANVTRLADVNVPLKSLAPTAAVNS